MLQTFFNKTRCNIQLTGIKETAPELIFLYFENFRDGYVAINIYWSGLTCFAGVSR